MPRVGHPFQLKFMLRHLRAATAIAAVGTLAACGGGGGSGTPAQPQSVKISGTVADGPLQGIDLDMHEIGELAPVVAALCALASSPSRLRGLAHIRGHETDRLSALTAELGALGCQVEEHPDGLDLSPAPMRGGRFRTYDDHRMAMALALLGLRVEGIEIEDPGVVAKSFPTYWSALGALQRPG